MTDNTTRVEERIQHENKPHVKYLPRLFAYVFGSAKAMCLIFISLITFLSLLRPVLAFIWGKYVDSANQFLSGQSILGLAGLLLAYYLIDYLTNLINCYTQAWEEIERLDVVQNNRFQEKFDTRIYKKFASLNSEMFEVPLINERIERLLTFTKDSWSGINREFMIKGYQIIAGAVSVAAIAMSLYLVAPPLCWIILIALIPTLYTSYVADRLKSKFVKQNTEEKREAGYFEKLMLGGAAKEIKALGLQDFIYGKWEAIISRYIVKERHTQMTSGLVRLLGALISNGTVAASIIYAIVLMTRGALSVGGLAVAMSLVSTLVASMGSLMRDIGSFISKKNEAATFFDVMDLPEQAQAAGEPVSINEIEARHLNYRYPLTDKYVLEDVCLSIKKGEHIAFVGENGAGKTTFVRLLSGLLTPSGGELLVNGQPEDDAGRATRYGSMASVLQSPAKYTTFTVADNVVIGDTHRARDESAIDSALDAAGFADADKDALLGKDIGGTELSGGQWQKLSIARAHYRGKEFILLDEPTGNLDPLAEAEVFQKYMALAAGCTLIMVTHRISVASLADRIVVFAGGRVAEDGTHEQLLARDGEYARLYHEQARWYDR